MTFAEHSGAAAVVQPRLLVSVRSVAEAEAALEGGAHLIDVKDPERGSLGRAENGIIAAVVRHTAGRRPVSAALGELADGASPPCPDPGLSYVKWGLAGWARVSRWRQAFLEKAEGASRAGALAVPVAYGDWRQADAPPVEDVLGFALERPGSILLLDTWGKKVGPHGGPPTLLHWLPVAEVRRLCERCRRGRVRIALAGSLGPEEIRRLLEVRPDWFAVRGAACQGGRGGQVTATRVRELVRLLGEGATRGS